jgi:hypothetical protein
MWPNPCPLNFVKLADNFVPYVIATPAPRALRPSLRAAENTCGNKQLTGMFLAPNRGGTSLQHLFQRGAVRNPKRISNSNFRAYVSLRQSKIRPQ